MEKKKKRVCFAASSGGHVEQILQLQPLMEEYDSCLITEWTSGTKDLKNKLNIPVHHLWQVNRHEKGYMKFLLRNIVRTVYYLLKERPRVIVTTGVLSMLPVCFLAKLTGAKIIYIESFAKTTSPTKSGKLMYKFADHFMVQWPTMLEVYPKAVYKGGLY